jgi:hypothetical protein
MITMMTVLIAFRSSETFIAMMSPSVAAVR